MLVGIHLREQAAINTAVLTKQQRIATTDCVGELDDRGGVLSIEEYMLHAIIHIRVTTRLGYKFPTEQIRHTLALGIKDSIDWNTYRESL